MRVAILFLLLSSVVQADLVLGVGAGKGILDKGGTPFERVFQVGYQKTVAPDLFVRPQAIYFTDNSGRGLSSFLPSVLVGVMASSKTGTELHIAAGPSYLQNPDGILGGHFQFTLEGCSLITDSHASIGLCWLHASSAGLEMPNNGRDFVSIQLRLLGL